MSTPPTSGLVTLPGPEASGLLLIDHQPRQHQYRRAPTTVSDAALELARAARGLSSPMLPTTLSFAWTHPRSPERASGSKASPGLGREAS